MILLQNDANKPLWTKTGIEARKCKYFQSQFFKLVASDPQQPTHADNYTHSDNYSFQRATSNWDNFRSLNLLFREKIFLRCSIRLKIRIPESGNRLLLKLKIRKGQ